ncbi:MutS-related protein [Pedobacter miscanthi]|uniref:MutS-related protein n=1 Tax=Pedobacter miscanthi TaxID=2259170 RepID=UPI002931EB1C|nr:DNA mismatch repair protein [Pedobacter miscanthi]
MNKFDIDKQTLTDLNIFDAYGSNKSLFSLFNFTSTIKGSDKLLEIFKAPSTDIEIIKQRQGLIRYLSSYKGNLNFDRTNIEFVESYLIQNGKIKFYTKISALAKSINYFFYPNQAYYLKEKGIKEIVSLLKKLIEVFAELDQEAKPELVRTFDDIVLTLFKQQLIKTIVERDEKKISLFELEQLDFIFRGTVLSVVKRFLDLIHQIDAYFSVVKVGQKYNFTLPKLDVNNHHLQIKGVFHPFLDYPVVNDVEFETGKNVCFLTGSNMAGKSTFLKSVGISIYLAHLGLPVPAAYMETGIWQGLISTINLPDNLNEGYSHFYNEVLRVKHVAEKIRDAKHIFVIFDELFRGTNVKDAFDGSLAIIKSFSKIKDCYFMISTHIIEVAEMLKDNENIMFKYLFTKMEGNKPTFTYTLMDGITDERIGMWIIENEGIDEILSSRDLM